VTANATFSHSVVLFRLISRWMSCNQSRFQVWKY